MPKRTGSNETINSVIKQTTAKITGEKIDGANWNYPTRNIRTASFSPTPSVDRSIRLSQSMSNTNTTAPNFYTPFTTPSAFQIPNNRKEVYLWAQWWMDNEPKVAAGIEFYSDFPLSEFELECSNGYVKDYFEDLVKRLNFAKYLPLISQEYHLRGDAFPFASIECEHCHGSNVDEHTNEKCKHEGATWKSLTIINPDQIEGTPFFIDQEPMYYMTPNEDMIKIVQEKKPKEFYDKIAPELRKRIIAREPIPLDPMCLYHFKRGAAPWQPFGTSMIRRLFPTLAYKDKLRQAQWLVAERHILPIKLVTVGSEERPASEEDLEAVQEELTNVANDPLLTLVTHHNFKFEYVGASGKVLQLTNEYELIDQEIIDGLMLNKAIINGEGPSYSNAQVGLLVMAKKLEKIRKEIAYWIEEVLFKSVAIWNGFTMEGERGQIKYIYPTVKWGDLQLRDNTGKLQMLVQAQQAGVISAQTLIESFDINYDQEVERLRFEQTANFINSPDASATGGGDMGGGMGGGMGGMGGGYGGDMGGGAPSDIESPESMGGGLDLGGAPGGAPMPTASVGNEENYRTAASVIEEIYERQVKAATENYNKRVASKQIVSEAHKNFLESQCKVTGRGYLGALPHELPDFTETVWRIRPDGGDGCKPLNPQAQEEMQNIRYHYRIAAKKEEKGVMKLFTNLEQKLYKIILSSNIPFAFYAQYQAGPGLQYQLDGAFPAIKLGVEADSKTYHSAPEKIMSDKKRDASLATHGWTILRFTEGELNEQPQEIVNVIVDVIKKLSGLNSGGQTKKTI